MMRRKCPLPSIYGRDLKLLVDIITLESVASPEREALKLLRQFGSLNAVLCASREGYLSNQRELLKDWESIRIVSEVSLEVIRGHVVDRPIVAADWQLSCYLLSRLDGLQRPHLWVLYLDGARRIIDEECRGVGSMDRVLAAPAEIIKPALRANASGIILAQNRTSGSSAPTYSDLELTESVRAAAAIFSIAVHDHFIVANGEVRSLLSLIGAHRNDITAEVLPRPHHLSLVTEGLPPGWWGK